MVRVSGLACLGSLGLLLVWPASFAAAGAPAAPSESGAVTGFVFLDEDRDGALGPAESGLKIVPVHLRGPVNRTVLTSMNGAYRFENLPAGLYDVTIEPGPEWQVERQSMYAGLSIEDETLGNVNFALIAVHRPPVGAAVADGGAGDTGPEPMAPGPDANAVAAALEVLKAIAEDDPDTIAALEGAMAMAERSGQVRAANPLVRALAALSAEREGGDAVEDVGGPAGRYAEDDWPADSAPDMPAAAADAPGPLARPHPSYAALPSLQPGMPHTGARSVRMPGAWLAVVLALGMLGSAGRWVERRV